MTKVLKLINCEKKLVTVKNKKACDTTSYDYCKSIDNGECYTYSYDVCGNDYSYCTGGAIDQCASFTDYSVCNGTGKEGADIGVDY